MKRREKLLQQTEFPLLLFIFCLILFNWHFLGLPGKVHGYGTYVYLFLAWAAVILLLFLMHRGSKMQGNEKGESKGNRSPEQQNE